MKFSVGLSALQNYREINIFIITLFVAFGFAGQSIAMDLQSLKSTNSVIDTNIIFVSAERSDGVKNFIKSVARRGINFLSNPDLSEWQRKREFEKLLKSSFDIKTIGRFALGRYWRMASTKQQKEYISLFEKMLVDVYSRRFNDYKGQNVKIIDVLEKSNTDMIVNSEVIPDKGPKFRVSWRVRFRNGKYKIIDIIVEGVSMALTHRSDFSAVIQRGGGKVDVLLDHLRQ